MAITAAPTRTAEIVNQILRCPVMFNMLFVGELGFRQVFQEDAQEQTGCRDRAEQADENAEQQGNSQALPEARREEVQNEGGDDRRSVRIADRRPCPAETFLDRRTL